MQGNLPLNYLSGSLYQIFWWNVSLDFPFFSPETISGLGFCCLFGQLLWKLLSSYFYFIIILESHTWQCSEFISAQGPLLAVLGNHSGYQELNPGWPWKGKYIDHCITNPLLFNSHLILFLLFSDQGSHPVDAMISGNCDAKETSDTSCSACVCAHQGWCSLQSWHLYMFWSLLIWAHTLDNVVLTTLAIF